MPSEDELKQVQLHSAGATVVAETPFSGLPIPSSEPLGAPLELELVGPFYMRLFSERPLDTVLDDLLGAAASVRHADVLALLAQFNWRHRVVAAYLAALHGMHDVVPALGNLLLRSDVCYAGRAYTVALLQLDAQAAAQVFKRYLDYYLTQDDLWFDQAIVMGGLVIADEARGASDADSLMDRWSAFVAKKPDWDLQRSQGALRSDLDAVRLAASRFAGGA